MDFLFDNPLANMPGVIFLLFYVLFSIFALVAFGVWKTRIDKTDLLPVPPIPPHIDPYEIAFLRGGINEVARSVIFSLRQKDFLIFEGGDKNSRIHRNSMQQNAANLLQIEQTALNWFSVSREPQEVFQSGGLKDILQPFANAYEARLENLQLLSDASIKTQISQARLILLAAILGLGGYKFFVAWMNGYRNVIGLIVVGAFASFFSFAVSKAPRLTKLGKAYLERLQLAFTQLKAQAASLNQAVNPPIQASQGANFAAVDPMLLGVGVFGAGILAGTMYDDYNKVFQRAQAASGGGSSCGSSCGSCSSGDSGGSSCGGSSCGSGCGGCGGGCS